MAKEVSHDLIYGAIWDGWRRWVVWSFSIGTAIALAWFRTATQGEFNLASLLLIPVLVIAWLGGKRQGLLMAFLAALAWCIGDIASSRQFSAPWIPWANTATHLMTYSLIAILAAKARQQFNWEHKNASTDALTGLHNRRAFFEAGVLEAERAKRYARPLSVVFLDLDDFKRLNDTRGHEVGDEALRVTAKALLGALRSSDRVARLGGDEFAVLLPEVDYDEALEAGRKIFSAVNNALGSFSPATCSIGVAWFEEIDREFPAILKLADELMYEVKRSGKNNIRTGRYAKENCQVQNDESHG